MTPYLTLQNIQKKNVEKAILQDVSLSFQEGMFISILGPSGCGKTTLLHILAGIAPPDSGSVCLQGRNITHLPAEKRNFGMVFQNHALFPNLTVAENIAYGLQGNMWPLAKKQQRIEELLAMIRLSDFTTKLPHELSGGQQQRVALARALARRPALLLLDEPLSALDAKVREELGKELLYIQRTTRVTTIMVTHDQEEALALADRIVLMQNGTIEQYGTPEELYRHPANVFAAEFIGHMNFFSWPLGSAGKIFGIRYEEVEVNEANERILQLPNTFVAKVEHRTLLGASCRLSLLLNDFLTTIHADVPGKDGYSHFPVGKLVAVTFPETRLKTWDAQS